MEMKSQRAAVGNHGHAGKHPDHRRFGNPFESNHKEEHDTFGRRRRMLIKFTAQNVETDFGCSGIGGYGPTSQKFIIEIKLPDQVVVASDKYESTPGSTRSGRTFDTRDFPPS